MTPSLTPRLYHFFVRLHVHTVRVSHLSLKHYCFGQVVMRCFDFLLYCYLALLSTSLTDSTHTCISYLYGGQSGTCMYVLTTSLTTCLHVYHFFCTFTCTVRVSHLSLKHYCFEQVVMRCFDFHCIVTSPY